MSISRQPDVLEGFFGPPGYSETVHCDKHVSPAHWPPVELGKLDVHPDNQEAANHFNSSSINSKGCNRKTKLSWSILRAELIG
jgi:hypothetical protein